MSNEVMTFGTGQAVALPAHLQNAENGIGDALKQAQAEGNRISIKGRAWRLIQDGVEVAVSGEPVMDLAIIAALPDVSRTYFDKDYEEGVATMPACWSTDGVIPDTAAGTTYSTSCAECPMNAPGSGSRDQSRACRFSKRIVVALPAELAVATPEAPARAYLMSIPATSLFGDKVADDQPKSLLHYGNFLAARGVDATMVVTRFSFDLNQTQPTLLFMSQRYLEQNEYAAACTLMRDPDTQAMLPLQYTKQAAAPLAKAIPGQAPGAVDVTAQVQPAAAAAVVEPATAGFGAPATAAVDPAVAAAQAALAAATAAAAAAPVVDPVAAAQAVLDAATAAAAVQPAAATPAVAGFGTPATTAEPAATATTQPVATAEPVVVDTNAAAATAGVASGDVGDLLAKWGA